MKIGIIALPWSRELVLLVGNWKIRLKKLFLAIPPIRDVWENDVVYSQSSVGRLCSHVCGCLGEPFWR